MRKIFDYFLDNVRQNYTIIRLLKENSQGTVELLRHNVTGQRFVFREFAGRGDVYQKLLGIDCPNLPHVYEVAEREGQTIILEEYIRGDNLAWLLEEGGFTLKESREILIQACKGVWALHSLGIVHRDIKPDNIILRGEDVVLIDFNASRISKPQMTVDTQVLGTTGFAAPEQYGIAQTDARADIYALGVLLNIMLTGEHPSKKLAKGKWGHIVEKCTMTNPDRRYQTVDRLMEVL